MPDIRTTLTALSERTIAREVALRHDEARNRFPLERNTVETFDEFTGVVGGYYAHHFRHVTGGASLSATEAAGRAKELLEQVLRRQGGDVSSAFSDAHLGINGGLRVILDQLAEGLKYEFVERYIRDVFDRQVAPNAWEAKVEIVRQFIQRCPEILSTAVDVNTPERYAQNYRDLIRSYVDGLQRASSMFRRL